MQRKRRYCKIMLFSKFKTNMKNMRQHNLTLTTLAKTKHDIFITVLSCLPTERDADET